MEIVETTSARSLIEISRAELLMVNAALNEVCNALERFEFQSRMTADRESVAALLKEVGALLDRMDAVQG